MLLLVLMMLCLVTTVLMRIDLLLLLLIVTAFLRVVLLLVLNLLQMMRIVRQALYLHPVTNQIVDVQPPQEEVCNVHHCCSLSVPGSTEVPRFLSSQKYERTSQRKSDPQRNLAA